MNFVLNRFFVVCKHLILFINMRPCPFRAPPLSPTPTIKLKRYGIMNRCFGNLGEFIKCSCVLSSHKGMYSRNERLGKRTSCCYWRNRCWHRYHPGMCQMLSFLILYRGQLHANIYSHYRIIAKKCFIEKNSQAYK